MIVLVDDLRNFQSYLVKNKDVKVFRNCYSAISFLKTNNQEIEQLWLDHDLGIYNGQPHDIFDLIDFIEKENRVHNNNLYIKEIIVHTSNPSGNTRIHAAMKTLYPVTTVNATEYF